jgi:thymidylate kinase
MILAIEGTSFAGKTTLIKELSKFFKEEDFRYLPCYVKALKIKDSQCPIPLGLLPDIESQVKATSLFLEVEKDRYNIFGNNLRKEKKLTIVDRSIFTLMAHSYAIEYGYLRSGLFGVIRDLILNCNEKLYPNHIIFLDTPQNILETRFPKKLPKTIFMEEHYNNYFKSFFFKNSIQDQFIIPGENSIDNTFNLAKTYINKHILNSTQ